MSFAKIRTVVFTVDSKIKKIDFSKMQRQRLDHLVLQALETKSNQVTSQSFFQDRHSVLFSIFLEETWCSEADIEGNMFDAVECVMVNQSLEFATHACRDLEISNPQRNAQKLINLYRAVKNVWLMKSHSFLNTQFVVQLHKQVMNGLSSTAGEFRTQGAAPASSLCQYAPPEDIVPRLKMLLEVVIPQIASCDDRNGGLRLCALFLSEFLLIHPFRNGNGRTARLLFGLLTKKFTNHPLTLYRPRKDYIDALERRYEDRVYPEHLFEYVKNCVERQASDIVLIQS